MSLLDDIQDSETARLIEVGNLKRKKEPPLPDWATKPWIFSGYRARIRCIQCLACGEKTEVLESVSMCERKDTETNPTREIPLDITKPFFVIPDSPKETIFSETTVATCPTCLIGLGFDF